MKTEVYKQDISTNEIEALAKEGSNTLLREELGLPPIEKAEENAMMFTFRKMTEDENKVFSVLFPRKTQPENYKEFIPCEALEAMKEFKETCPHHIVETYIWHAKEYDPDPILVVTTCKDSEHLYHDRREWLVARWGDALDTFENLKKKSVAEWKAKRITHLQRVIRKAKNMMEETKEALVITDPEVDPSFYGGNL